MGNLAEELKGRLVPTKGKGQKKYKSLYDTKLTELVGVLEKHYLSQEATMRSMNAQAQLIVNQAKLIGTTIKEIKETSETHSEEGEVKGE